MALEHDIASLVEASEALTSTVDNKIQSIDSTVSSKMTEVNSFVAHQKAIVDSALDDLSVIGDGNPGTRSLNIAKLYAGGNGGVSNVHFKLPFNVNEHSEMFHLTVTGYAYGESKVVDATFVGYCYATDKNVRNIECIGSHAPTLYRGSDGYAYCRLSFENIYHLTLTVDTMRVGNGRLLKKGDVEVIVSAQDDASLPEAEQA